MRNNIFMITMLLMLGFVMTGCEVVFPYDHGYRSGHSDNSHESSRDHHRDKDHEKERKHHN
ncbi:MAG: hypothetical protein COW18_11300 [Zetaproteobacteria bacterium CG12_big_fil_rev_8_21_14_0_65_54_13]|nr:MAG: hypothetical protein COX55_08720 [Zetaproteobacteria bacterium CG23_combo_of_CG06-09_8_20_14_all_54_7]PIW45721.1 MAG: hypothetical protein COW18_11300 [Zetaproteobacteria bacterium CG12_big_fil_rev_8_21_14_0_65_54_13]PIX54410.1 MAG: hypothetical protein COZ50_07925 [Zetaproteobacteria bacterium CG_4_10_14_3_um_filter_54_28]PJA28809.1 MAG: hypothetical protein CO188_08145 [Zetaproteobacteria bacterium CG_4_9_14_3_um_filter_54_145]